MSCDVDLLAYLPLFMQDFTEIAKTLNAENPEFEIAWEAAHQVLNNQFVETANEYGISKFEKALKIFPSKEDALEFRRQRILSRLRTRPPFTLAFLHQQLDTLLGVGRWTCCVDCLSYQLTIGTRVEDKTQRAELVHMVNQIKPAHIAFQMYLFCDTVKASAHAAATPCRIASRYTVRLPDFVALPDAQAQVYTAGAAERMRITIEIGGNSL